MEILDPLAVARLDAHGWYDFLPNEYFKWKYTARNRYGSTTRHLKQQADTIGLEGLLALKEQLFAAGKVGVRDGIVAAKAINGLGYSGASGLMALLFPARFGTADQFVVKALRKVRSLPEAQQHGLRRMNPENLTLADTVSLISLMTEKAHALNSIFASDLWTPRKIDKVLWGCRDGA
jgi:hypothetical protein